MERPRVGQVLDYVQWRNFAQVVAQARIACENSGQAVSDHFAGVSNMVTVGSGAKRNVDDVRLSRYACYLVVQDADPNKPIVALGQTYFAVRTREADLAEEAVLQGMSEDQLRLYVRNQLTSYNQQLADAAHAAGVPSNGFAAFQDHGYRGLYAEETACDIAARKGLAKGQRILDWMGTDELAANLFRASLTEQKLRNDPTIADKEAASRAHHDVGAAVRGVIIEQKSSYPYQRSPLSSSSGKSNSVSWRGVRQNSSRRCSHRLRLPATSDAERTFSGNCESPPLPPAVPYQISPNSPPAVSARLAARRLPHAGCHTAPAHGDTH